VQKYAGNACSRLRSKRLIPAYLPDFFAFVFMLASQVMVLRLFVWLLVGYEFIR